MVGGYGLGLEGFWPNQEETKSKNNKKKSKGEDLDSIEVQRMKEWNSKK